MDIIDDKTLKTYLTDEDIQSLELSYTDLLNLYNKYADHPSDKAILHRAFEFACRAHASQRRVNGEPYMLHPLAVAKILTELELDLNTLVAALLHDTVEDTDVTEEDINKNFGPEVAGLVDGVTKLAKMSFSSKEELQAENFRKMFIAMAKDLRVVLIKLADRLHNMRTLKYMRSDKQGRISQETLDIYAPLAHRLGIYKWKWELEDICLRYLEPQAYYELVGAISQKREEREAYMAEIIATISNELQKMSIKSEIEGRPKHFYSIYRKMKSKGKLLDQIYDLFACRIIVETVADCYAVFGLVHEMFKPMPGRFKDYIAMPKPNMYQSLHTTVFGPKGMPFEIQIRTVSMHRIAEFGIAAHYRYKESGNSNKQNKEDKIEGKLSWLRQFLDWQKDMNDAGEFMENLKSGLALDEVFVFTPKGDVVSLPVGSCPIDFAYNIHSNVGNHMYGAKINGRIAPLTQVLNNADIIEVLTSDKVQGPSRDWLKIVKSSGARNKINQWFKKETRDENIVRGKEIFEREIKKTGFAYKDLCKPEYIDSMLKKNHFLNMDDFYAAVGYGNFSVNKAIPRLRDSYIISLSDEDRTSLGYRLGKAGQVIYDPDFAVISDDSGKITQAVNEKIKSKHAKKNRKNEYGIVVKGLDNCLVRLSQCCNPVYGDKIIGYISRGKGVAVHRQDCSNIRRLLSNLNLNEIEAEKASRLIECSWGHDSKNTSYQVRIKIMAHDRNNLLSDISNAIAEEKVSIISGQMDVVKDLTANFILTIEINNQIQYDKVLGRLKALRDIIEVRRI